MKKIFTILLNLLTVCLLAQAPIEFTYTSTSSSGTIQGQIQINGLSGSNNDWIAAFDESGNCCGASELIVYGEISYMNLTIYGDDAISDNVDEGINNNESFTLRLFDSSEGEFLNYQSIDSLFLFDNWSNTNGAPMPSYSDPNTIYNFLSDVEISLTITDTNYCLNDDSFFVERWLTIWRNISNR